MSKTVTALLLVLIIRSIAFGDDKVININLGENIDFSGDGVVLFRGCEKDGKQCYPAAIPYHAGYYVNFLFKIKVNENVYVEDILTAENQSFSAGYSRQNVLKNRLAAFYETKAFKLQAGNLGRIRSGNGLTIDALYSDGMRVSALLKDFNLDFLVSGAGLVLYEDLYILQLTDKHRRVGLYANVHRGQDYPVRNLVYSGLFVNYPITKNTSVYGEYSSFSGNSFNLFSNKSAYLLGARTGKDYKKFHVDGQAEYRFYDEDFNHPLRNLPEDTFFALEEEDKRFNNWWNYLYIFGDVTSWGLNVHGDYALNREVKLFTDYEYLNITARDSFLNYKDTGTVRLYKTGFLYYLGQKENAFVSYSISNRFLNPRSSGMIYNLYNADYSSLEFHFKF